MEKWKKRFVDLITSLALGCEGSASVVPYYPQKTRISTKEPQFFARSTPERHGISSKRLYQMLCDLECEGRANIHNLMVLRDGEVICECSRDGYDVNLFHLSHSMSKTVTGMLIGVLVDEGRLDVSRRLVSIFPEVPYKDRKFPNITVRHLLTMTSGVDFNEAGSVSENKWTEAFFRSTVKYIPGSKFNYNSMNTYILARIVERVSGESFSSFLASRLFSPLGITNYLWEKSAEGCEKGGWGLYLSAESWAKLGMLFLTGGVFLGTRVLSEAWIRESSRAQATSPDFNGEFDYGYQVWVDSARDEVVFNGMLGQTVWICPKNRIVAVMMGGNNEIFRETSAHELLRRYLGGEMRDELSHRDVKLLHEKETRFCDHKRWVRPLAVRRGFLVWLGLRPKRVFDESWSPLLGNYSVGKNNISLLPLITAAMQNNLNASISRISFVREGDVLLLVWRERGRDYRLVIGLYEYKSAVLDMSGEKYLVKTLGEVLTHADGRREYRIEVIFPELPNTRMIKVTESAEGGILHIAFSEMPNDRIVENLLARASELSSPVAFGVDLIEKKFGDGVVLGTVKRTFNPTLAAVSDERSDADGIIKEYDRRMAEESTRAKLVRAFVDRFFKEEPEDGGSPKEQKKRLVSGVIDRISKIAKSARKNK